MKELISKELKPSAKGQFHNCDMGIEEEFEKRTSEEKREVMKWAIKLAYKSNVLRLSLMDKDAVRKLV